MGRIRGRKSYLAGAFRIDSDVELPCPDSRDGKSDLSFTTRDWKSFNGDWECIARFTHPDHGVCRHLYRKGETYRLRFGDEHDFLMDPSGVRVDCRVSPSVSISRPHAASRLLLGPVLAFQLSRLGYALFHGTVVTTQESAIGVIGSPGVGKSTLTAALLKAGYSLAADDVMCCRVGASVEIVPTGSYLKISRRIAAQLGALREPGMPGGFRDEELLVRPDQIGSRIERREVALSHICELKAVGSGVSSQWEPYDVRKATHSLMRHQFGGLLYPRDQVSTRLRLIGEIARSLPMYGLCTPHEFPSLARSVELIGAGSSR